MKDLQILHEILYVDQPAVTVFDVDGAFFDQFVVLPLAKMGPRPAVDRGFAVHEGVPGRFDGGAQDRIAADGAQFDQGVALIGQRAALFVEVRVELLQGRSQRALVAIGPQPEVDLEQALSPGFDRAADHARKTLVVLRIQHGLGALRGALSGVNEHQLDIGGPAQFPAAALPQRADTEDAGLAGGHQGGAVLPALFPVADIEGRFQDHLGQRGELAGEGLDVFVLLQDLAHADPQHLLVLVPVQQLLAAGEAFHPGQPRGQFALHLLPRPDDTDHPDVLQHGEQVLVLHPEEVFPQEIAGAEEFRHRADHFLLLQLVEHLLHRPAARHVGQDLVDQVIEVFQGLGGIGRPGQQMGELLDEGDHEPQFMEFPRVGDLRSPPVGHLERVLHPVPGGRDVDPPYVYVAQRQGGREGVQERRRVPAGDREPGRFGPGVVVDLHVYREHGGVIRVPLVTEVVHDALVDPSLHRPGAAGPQAAHGVLDFPRYGGPVRGRLRRRVHAEHVHDLPLQSQRRRGDAGRRGRCARTDAAAPVRPEGTFARTICRFGVDVGEHVPAAYAQPAGRQESRQDGHHRQVVEGDDGETPRRLAQGFHLDLRGVLRPQPADHRDVAPDHFRLVTLEIGRLHPAEVIPDQDLRQVVALELFRKFRERCRIRHGALPVRLPDIKLLNYIIYSTHFLHNYRTRARAAHERARERRQRAYECERAREKKRYRPNFFS